MIKPLADRVLIQPLDPFAEELAEGIVNVSLEIPQSLRGTVDSVGPDATTVKPGDVVLYHQYAPTAAQESLTDKRVILPEADILAIIA